MAKSRGQLQDQLRKDGFNVIGGSAYGDRLENDRAFAQCILTDIELQTAKVFEFTHLASAGQLLAQHPGRYVLKFNGSNVGSKDNYVGRLSSGFDVQAVLQTKASQSEDGSSFILMDYVAEVVTIYPEWRGYEFVLVHDQILVVDPKTFEIVAILEA